LHELVLLTQSVQILDELGLARLSQLDLQIAKLRLKFSDLRLQSLCPL
jgi:hypothetical protein